MVSTAATPRALVRSLTLTGHQLVDDGGANWAALATSGQPKISIDLIDRDRRHAALGVDGAITSARAYIGPINLKADGGDPVAKLFGCSNRPVGQPIHDGPTKD